ncbi:MAG: hypothetical protein QM744_13495 [Mesorhizobium sp.]
MTTITISTSNTSNDADARSLNGTLSTALLAGEMVRIMRDGVIIGSAAITGTSWTYTGDGADGVYIAQLVDKAGALAAQSELLSYGG